MNRTPKSLAAAAGIIIILVIGVCVAFFARRTPAQPSPKEIVPTLPGPLAAVEFPSQVTTYPPDWPPDLRYPVQFSLAEATSGVLPQGITKGWAAKLVYQGDPRSAADLLSTFFTSKGWQIIERTELDSGGFLILLQRGDKQHTGAVVIDPDTKRPGYTKIVTTIFP